MQYIQLYVHHKMSQRNWKKNQVLVKNLNFLAGMTRRFVAIGKAEQIQPSFSTDKKYGKYAPLFPDHIFSIFQKWSFIGYVFGFTTSIFSVFSTEKSSPLSNGTKTKALSSINPLMPNSDL